MNYEEMYERVKAELQDKYDLCYVDYRDELPKKVVAECLEQKDLQPLLEECFYLEQQCDAAHEVLDEIGERLYKNHEWLEFKQESDLYDKLRYLVHKRDVSEPERECWRQTGVNGRVLLFSNYDCWVPPYDAGGLDAFHDYLETAMRVLCLNPKKVKEVCSEWTTCRGRWPNYPWRDGKEVVSYEGFSRILRESCNYGLLCFCGAMNMRELWDNIDKQDELVIP